MMKKLAALKALGATCRNNYDWDAHTPDGAPVFICWAEECKATDDGMTLALVDSDVISAEFPEPQFGSARHLARRAAIARAKAGDPAYFVVGSRGIWRGGRETTLGLFPILYRVESITSRGNDTYARGRMVDARIEAPPA